jgi:hypothetical protein
MNLPRYEYYASSDQQYFSFYSDGPNGQIIKVVVYSKMNDDPEVYNLAFGDEDPVSHQINDDVRSNNNDRDMVLATVAITVNEFSVQHGNHYIHVVGRTPARTRLYQMSIARLIIEIKQDFEVYGYINGNWEDFEPNVNYEAFLVKRK